MAVRKSRFLIARFLSLRAKPKWTPSRPYDVRKRDKEGDARLVYSMDAPEIYGPVAHQLTFAEAARRGLICHYRVIISVVTTGMVNDHLLRHGEVLVQGNAVQARRSRRWNRSRSQANSRAFHLLQLRLPDREIRFQFRQPCSRRVHQANALTIFGSLNPSAPLWSAP